MQPTLKPPNIYLYGPCLIGGAAAPPPHARAPSRRQAACVHLWGLMLNKERVRGWERERGGGHTGCDVSVTGSLVGASCEFEGLGGIDVRVTGRGVLVSVVLQR